MYLIGSLSCPNRYLLCACLLTAFRDRSCVVLGLGAALIAFFPLLPPLFCSDGSGPFAPVLLQLCGLLHKMLAAWTHVGQLLVPFKRTMFDVAPSVAPIGPGAMSKARPEPPRRVGHALGQKRCSCTANDRNAGRVADSPRRWFSLKTSAGRFRKVVYPHDVGEPPLCRKCEEPAVLRRVDKPTINHGRPFWTCRSCDAFAWADCPLCYCGDGATSRRQVVSKRKGNQGKFFFSCARLKSNCDFFAWEDALPALEERLFSSTQDVGADFKAVPRSGMLRTMPPNFLNALRFAVSHRGRIRLSGDMLVRHQVLLALAVAWEFQSKRPLLVVCPAYRRYTWYIETRQWLGPSMSVFSISCEADVKEVEDISSSCAVIASFHMLPRLPEEWLDKADVVLVDESHSLRGEDTSRYQIVKRLLRCDHVIFLCAYSSKTAEQLCPQLPLWAPPSDRHDD